MLQIAFKQGYGKRVTSFRDIRPHVARFPKDVNPCGIDFTASYPRITAYFLAKSSDDLPYSSQVRSMFHDFISGRPLHRRVLARLVKTMRTMPSIRGPGIWCTGT